MSSLAQTSARSFLLALAVLAAAPSPNVSAQGETAFVRGRGNFDLVASFSRDSFDDFRLGDSPVAPIVDDVRRDTYTLYGAYGLTDDIDIIASAAWIDARADAEQFLLPDESDLQNLTLGTKVRLTEKRWGPGKVTFAALPGVKVPLTDYATYEENPINAPGHGQVDVRLRFVAQYQLDLGHWLAVESGYDVRFEEPADEVPIQATLGINVLDQWTLSPFLSRVVSVGDDDFDSNLSTSGVSFFRYGIGTYISVTDSFGLTANYRRTDEGRNESQGFTVGTVFRF